MNLSDRDRKLLWAKAGNTCSFRHSGVVCTMKLATTVSGEDTVLGEECHIVGDKPGSARYQAEFPDRDAYQNAILMCGGHHKMIDDAEQTFTVDVLHQMKLEHEVAQSRPASASSISNSEFVTEAKGADRAIGMDLDTPVSLSGVKSTLKAEDVREAIGVRVSGGMTITMNNCPRCGTMSPGVHVGRESGPVTCPRCGHQFTGHV